jgi:hypothetical protein
MDTETLRERLAYLAGRLAQAERIGRAAHIDHCRQKYEGIAAILANRTDGSGT